MEGAVIMKKYDNRTKLFTAMVNDAIPISFPITVKEGDPRVKRIPIHIGVGTNQYLYVVFKDPSCAWVEMVILESINKELGVKKQWILTGKSLRKWAWLPLLRRNKKDAHYSIKSNEC